MANRKKPGSDPIGDDERMDISSILFEWYPPKAASNLKKHRVSFEEAGTEFGDKKIAEYPDREHSEDELRYLAIGRSELGRLLLVVFAPTEIGIRIISARLAERWERREYEIANEQE
jgi:uncharacterized DUF497 family protein